MRALGFVVLFLVTAPAAFAAGLDTDHASAFHAPDRVPGSTDALREARLETLWIFEDDFSTDMGWTAYDLSGTLGQTNYWHHDTIRLTEPYLGTSTWWCGTYNQCWRQPRGYGNNWSQLLVRTMVEVGAESAPGDEVILEFDQRYAMERNYDYGYVEVKGPADSEWVTLAAYNNTGFQGAGIPHDWDHPTDGHVSHNISTYAGQEIELRFRFESDFAYSAQDEYDNPQHSVKDGAWQWDNLTITVNDEPVFFDDAESGNMDWVHDDVPPTGQTNVTWWRGRYKIDCFADLPFSCSDPPTGTWMYWAVDPFTCKMVNGEYAVLVSPPIDISGAEKLVGAGHIRLDCPVPTNDIFNLYLASDDVEECVTSLDGFVDEDPGWWYGGPLWDNWIDDWDAFTGNDWLAIRWDLLNDAPPEEPHGAGLILNRQRVGIPSGDAGTSFDRDTWNTFHDWFQDDIADALLDTAGIRVKDDEGVQSLYLMASNDDGTTWDSYACNRESPESNWWDVPPPANQIVAQSEILYYYEATDGVGNVAVYPSTAPGRTFEFSILPLDPEKEILLVDKHGRRTPGAERDYGFYDPRGHYKCYSEYYYREALDILGYDWETYDVDVPSGSVDSEGPCLTGMQYYDTQIWFTSDFDAYTLWPSDQWNLIQWLNEAGGGEERNLFLTGNDIGRELVGTGQETLNFFMTWLAADYIQDAVGEVTVDSVPGLQDHPGGFPFMPDDGDPSTPIDGDCALQGGCPVLMHFDVVDARSGIAGNEVPLDYKRLDHSLLPAGVAYTHQSLGYQSVYLGFGFEFMRDGTCFGGAFYTPEGYHVPGIVHRVQLMGNILDYFGLTPEGPGTGVPEDVIANVLSHAYPNPFNPATTITYSVRQAGPVTIRIHNLAGRVVRTLLDAELEAGVEGHVVWDGTNDRGERCASGVYFYRITAPDFTAARKMVMLK